MRKILFLFLIMTTPIFHAQDTLYLNEKYKETTPEEAIYYRIDDRNTPGDQDLIRRTFYKNGNLKSETPYHEKKEKLIPTGIWKFYYENGQLFYSQPYKKGERNGELVAFWEDGSKRRHDVYKKGKLQSGKVWNIEGEEIEHYPVLVPARFPGGKYALNDYLRDNIPHNPSQPDNTEVRVVISLLITKDGSVEILEVVEEAPQWYIAVTINTLKNMPKWEPGRFMGDPINVKYALPVTFKK